MRRCTYLLLVGLLLSGILDAEDKVIRGKVTYIASGVIYTSLGREVGLTDSSFVYVMSALDTIGTLRVFAASSSSSACNVLTSKRPITLDDVVLARVTLPEPTAVARDTVMSGASSGEAAVEPSREAIDVRIREVGTPDFIDLHGRISAQFYGSYYSNDAFNTAQPGVVLNIHAGVRDLPLRFEMYSNIRTLLRRSTGPVSRGAINQSRVYRLALVYDDGTNSIGVGRMIPGAIPGIGYVDGLILSRRFGRFELGSLAGYQPDLALRGMASDFKKVGVFARYTSDPPFTLSLSSAYARTYNHADLDREVVSTQVSAFSAADLSVFASSEVDLRKKSGSELVFSPSLTSVYVNINYRITRSVSVGLGGDAARSVFAFSSVRSIPDSLLDRRLKSGTNLNLNLTFPGGITVSNTYAPRASGASFGKEYSNYSSVGMYDIFSSGIGVRSNMTINSNAFTNSLGYGGYIQRNFGMLIDLTLRYQRFGYTVRKTNQTDQSSTVGADLLVTLSRRLAVMASYDRMQAFGSISQSIFAELTVRF